MKEKYNKPELNPNLMPSLRILACCNKNSDLVGSIIFGRSKLSSHQIRGLLVSLEVPGHLEVLDIGTSLVIRNSLVLACSEPHLLENA